MAKGSMRDQMPQVAELIDRFRAAFGEENINAVLRAGMRGEPVFYATENGHTVGTPPVRGVRVGLDGRGRRVLLDGQYGPEDEEITKYQAMLKREQTQQGGRRWK